MWVVEILREYYGKSSNGGPGLLGFDYARMLVKGHLRLPVGAARRICAAYPGRASVPLLRRLVSRRFYGFTGGRRVLSLLSEKGRKIGFIPHGRGPGSRLSMTVVYRAGRAAAYCFLTVIARGSAAVKARILR